MKKFITTLFVGFLGLVLLNSCSEDNEEPMSVKTAHIGAWNTSMESSNWKSINIESNGTMKYGYLSAEELEEKGYVWEKPLIKLHTECYKAPYLYPPYPIRTLEPAGDKHTVTEKLPLVLEPYGCTNLRISYFPRADLKK